MASTNLSNILLSLINLIVICLSSIFTQSVDSASIATEKGPLTAQHFPNTEAGVRLLLMSFDGMLDANRKLMTARLRPTKQDYYLLFKQKSLAEKAYTGYEKKDLEAT
ncbi:hypothetical protein MNBD_GAMMA12-3941 [hydrothermal vent metagenome]|uniref:Uncharacterized protein n=1 Tax=hydrothermal vent metagenome TaxID=652676 RepID=A0A3B0YUW0_9ZZZZ